MREQRMPTGDDYLAAQGIRPMDGQGKPALPLAARVEALRRREIWADQITPKLDQRYIVKGWLMRSAMSVVYGPSNSGKSFLCLDIAQHVAPTPLPVGIITVMLGGGYLGWLLFTEARRRL